MIVFDSWEKTWAVSTLQPILSVQFKDMASGTLQHYIFTGFWNNVKHCDEKQFRHTSQLVKELKMKYLTSAARSQINWM